MLKHIHMSMNTHKKSTSLTFLWFIVGGSLVKKPGPEVVRAADTVHELPKQGNLECPPVTAPPPEGMVGLGGKSLPQAAYFD